MKKLIVLFTVFVSLFIWSCGNSDNISKEDKKAEKQNITQDMILGEWECVDITNGVTHMENIAKMQPHMVFHVDGKIFAKQKLPDGSFTEQKLADYKIANGVLSSEIFEVNPYIEGGKLIVEVPSEDNKKVYKKIGE